MAQREGSVSFYLFIVSSVLFIVMTVLFFVDNAEKQEALEKLETAERSIVRLDRMRREISDEIDVYKQLIAGANADEWADAAEFRNHFLNDELKAKAEKAINDALTALGEATRSYETLVEPYSDLQVLFQKMIESREDALAKQKAALAIRDKTQQETVDELNTLKQEKEQQLQRIQDIEARYEDLDGTARTRETELLAQIENEREQRVLEVTTLRRQSNFQQNEIRSLQNRLEKLQAQVFKEDSLEGLEPDGELQYVLAQTGKGWINLGKVDHLTKGVRFRVFQTVKGGKKIAKGSVEVQKVDEDMSEVRIIEELDPLNPIVAGDYVSSPFYDPRATPVFVFAGTEMESKEVTREYVVAKVERYGGMVKDSVDQSTDFLVAMKNYENTPEYKTARELGVRVIRERDLLEFIGH